MGKLCVILLFSISLFANVGKIISVKGDAEIISNGIVKQARNNDVLNENDVVVTKSNSRLQIKFIDKTIVTLGKNSTLNINKYVIDSKNSKVDLAMEQGSFKVISGEISKIARENFKFQAKTATIGIRGTVFVGDLGEINRLGCLEGAIDVKIGDKTSLVQAGNQLKFESNRIIKTEKLIPREYETISGLGLNKDKVDENFKNAKYDYKAKERIDDFLSKKQQILEAKKENSRLEYYKDEINQNIQRLREDRIQDTKQMLINEQ